MILHIPKTAGTSLRQVVAANYPGRRCLYMYTLDHDAVMAMRDEVAHAAAVYGHYWYGFHELLGVDGRYVTVLREPEARVRSMFAQLGRNDDNEWYARIRDGLTLLELLESEECAMLNNHMCRILAAHEPTTTTHDRDVLDAALHHIDQHFAAVGVTERMDESLDHIGAALGWTASPRLERLNASDTGGPPLDDATRRAIRHFNRLDAELYRRGPTLPGHDRN